MSDNLGGLILLVVGAGVLFALGTWSGHAGAYKVLGGHICGPDNYLVEDGALHCRSDAGWEEVVW